MRIGLDLRMLNGGSGISRYIFELSTKILSADKSNQYVLFFNRLDEQTKKAYEGFGHKMVETHIPHYSLAEQTKLPGILKKEKLDLVHFPHFNAPIFYQGNFVVTIHDLTHTKFPGKNKFRFLHRLVYNFVIKNAIKKSAKIIAVSQFTKKDIVDYFGVPSEKINVIYEGANETYSMMDKEEALAKVTNRFGISKPFILYVGVLRRYKNVPRLAEVFDKLIDKGLDLLFVLAGSEDPFYPEIKEQILSVKHKERIKMLGRVTDDELNYLYNAATLFVLPSLIEGFGLTALEAASCGVPIACSDIPTLREVVGQAADYFDPDNRENMVDVLYSLLTNPTRLEELANLGLKRATNFSWKKAAEETISIYSDAVNGSELRLPRRSETPL